MYNYRQMTREQREAILRIRTERGFPLHAPPHLCQEPGQYFLTASCFEHQRFFDEPELLDWLASEILAGIAQAEIVARAWVFLPNHYHLLIQYDDPKAVSDILRKAHSSLATTLNAQQHVRKRKVWYEFSERHIRNERHHHASLNYIHFNPIKHGYVDSYLDWPWSSVHQYIAAYGLAWIEQIWLEHPIRNFGSGWDW